MEMTVFRELLLWIWHQYPRPWETTDPKVKPIYDEIQVGYPPFSRLEELEAAFPTENETARDFHRFLHMEPATGRGGTLVPVASVTCKPNTDRSHPEIRLRIGVFVLEGDQLHSIGWRFETPEGAGRHNLYHAQLITWLDSPENPMPGCPPWLPTWDPTIPLDAENPVQLVLCLLISLYGVEYLDKLQETEFTGPLREYMNSLRFARFQPKYWRVENDSGKDCWATWHTDRRFKDIMRARHNATRFAEIGRREYEAYYDGLERRLGRQVEGAFL